MMKVVLDAGHGGSDFGAEFQGRLEKDDTLKLTLAISRILKNNNIDTVIIRMRDQFLSPAKRIMLINRENGDLVISIHRSFACKPDKISGAKVLLYDNGDEIKINAANSILKLLEVVGYQNLGISEQENISLIKNTQAPSLLLSVGYIDSYQDNRLYDSKFQQVTEAIAFGILDALGLEPDLCDKKYYIQVGIFRNYDSALRLQNQIIKHGLKAEIVKYEDLFTVRVGHFCMLDETADLERRLQCMGYHTLIISE